MHQLENGCRCSEISVIPKNWKSKGADMDAEWMIWYRFYDPTVEKPKLVRIKAGVNTMPDIQERRAVVRALIEEEWRKLRELGYNPILKTYITPIEVDYEVDPSTPWIKALEKAVEKLKVVDRTRQGIRNIIKHVDKASQQLRISGTPINQISRRHLKAVLDRCGENSKRWSGRTYNLYRAYLLMLFKELVELEAVPANPVRDISKQKEFKRLRAVLTPEQRQKVKEHLEKEDPRFLQFVHLFFHSGGRLRELTGIRARDVDLRRQVYKSVIRKGKAHREVERTIKDIAVQYWEFFLKGAKPDDFLFGRDFKPAAKAMVTDTITRRWQTLVKEGLGITADFYSLKHLNTDEVAEGSSLEDAATLNGHTNTEMVRTVYAVGEKERQHQRLKKLGNEF